MVDMQILIHPAIYLNCINNIVVSLYFIGFLLFKPWNSEKLNSISPSNTSAFSFKTKANEPRVPDSTASEGPRGKQGQVIHVLDGMFGMNVGMYIV